MLRNLLVFASQQNGVAMDDRHFRAKGAIEMGKLGCNIPSAQDDQLTWLLCKAQSLVAGNETGFDQSRNIRDVGPPARRNQYFFGPQLLGPYFERFLANEARFFSKENGVLDMMLESVLYSVRVLIDNCTGPRHDLLEVNAPITHVNPELRRIANCHRNISAVDEYLRGNAASIQAGTAQPSLLYDGGLKAKGGPRIRNVQTGTGPDHDEIKLAHD
jgi:hypothetical protein